MENKERDLTLRDYYKIFMKNKWFIGIFTFIVSVLAIIISLMLPLWYAGTASIIRPSSQVLDANSFKVEAMGLFGSADAVTNRYLSILNSRNLKERMCREYDLVNIYDVEGMDKAVLKFEDKFKIETGDENQINITVFDKNQERVAAMTNYAVHLLDSINISLATGYGQQEKDFIEEQLNEVLDSVNTLENELEKYMESRNVLDAENQIKTQVEYAADLKYQILLKKMELKIMETTRQNSLMIDSHKLELKELINQYNELFRSNDDLFINLNQAPEIGIYIKDMERKIEYLNQVLLFLGPLYEQAKITEAKNIPTFEVLDYAHRPDRKSKPKRSVIVIAAFLFALLTSGVYVLLKETQD